MKRALKTILLALLAPTALTAAPVSAERAVEAASAWVRRERGRPDSHRQPSKRGRRQMAPRGDPTGRIRTCSVGGTNLFHLVSLDGGGFVAVSADDSHHPIMGFSPSGELPDGDMNNPFWSLAGADAMARRGIGRPHRHNRKQGARRGGSRGEDPVSLRFSDSTAPRNTRTRLMAAASTGSAVKSETGIEDVRVSPLVQSKWYQVDVWNNGKKSYNYYTPFGWPCGCVATALAQLMRYHRHPASSITAQEFTCCTNGIAVKLTMKGGIYDWNSMPLEPSSSITDAQREAIGRICYDAGVSAKMQYGRQSSSAYLDLHLDTLLSVFGYKNAQCYLLIGSDDSMSIPEKCIKDGILANLDANNPILLGVANFATSEGHAIIADGYGYVDGVLYCHLNMGWNGSSDYWYALPEIDAGDGYYYNSITTVLYNIFPGKKGELLTGRVVDKSGNPIRGATISAAISYTDNEDVQREIATTTTSENGIYAILTPSETDCEITITAIFEAATNSITAATSTSLSWHRRDLDSEDYDSEDFNRSIGNSWGNDIVLDIPTPFKFILR